MSKTLALFCLCLFMLESGCDSPSQHTNTGPTITQDPYSTAREQCMQQINEYRATIGLPPLVHDSTKDACTDNQARLDSESGTAHGAFGNCRESAQNECPNWGSTESVTTGCLAAMWAEGPGQPYSAHGHYINMTNTSYTKTSCGFYTTPTGKVWAVFNFY